MASLQDCEQALATISERLSRVDPDVRSRHVLPRSVSCRVPDLDVLFLARLDAEGLSDLRSHDGSAQPQAQLRLTASSDDLVALLDGRLHPATAWMTGRLRLEASVADLLRLRSLLQRGAPASS